jgi:oligoendopeptidase F
MSVQSRLFERSEIPVNYTWNAESVFASPEAWEAAYDAMAAQLSALQRFQGRLGESPQILADWLEAAAAAGKQAGRLMVYANLSHAVDTRQPAGVGRSSRARSLMAQLGAATAFSDPEMIAIGFDRLWAWLRQEPRLAAYAHYIERLADRQEHVRSAEVEELLGQLADPFRTVASIHSSIADTDLSFTPARDQDYQPVEVAQGTINALLTHPDRQVRRTAWENYADSYLALKNGLAACLAAGVKQNVLMARARRYDSALEASLAGNKIPTAVFHNLIEVYRENLPTWHRYWRIRRKALGYEHLHVYDIKAPLTQAKVEVPYPQAVDWILQGMQPLGEEYMRILRGGVGELRWVDVYPNKGKRSGAFSAGSPGTYPFILMSYNDDLFSMSTLAHELGHSLHSYLAWQRQPFVYARYSLFVAEVASNFNQAMVRDYLLRTQTERDFQIGLIEEALSNFHRYFFIMPTLARFELEIHQRVERGQSLTAEDMNTLMADLFAEGYGDEVVVDRERVGITWAQFPNHLYANFYVFQYATGISGAHALAQRILSGMPGAAQAYLDFLSAGGSMYPMDALKLAGVDLSSPEPVQSAFQVLDDLVNRLEAMTA